MAFPVKFNARQAYRRDLRLVDGVENGVMYECDSENVKTGRSSAILAVRGSVADSDIADVAVASGFQPSDTVIGVELVDETDLIPSSRCRIVLDEDGLEWIVLSAIERTPNRVYDCISGRAATVDLQ